MSQGIVNYNATYFETKVVTKIHGEPTYEEIKRLHNVLKANAGRVPSVLGGGRNGYLALVISPTQYAMVSNVAFNRPLHPGQLILPPGISDMNARIQRENYNEALRLFRECEGVDSALRA